MHSGWVGLICALCPDSLDRTKLMPGRVMVLLVCSGAVLGLPWIYEPLKAFAGAGAGVPLWALETPFIRGYEKLCG